MKRKKRLAALLLAAALLLSGCSGEGFLQQIADTLNSAPGEAWVNSGIEGAIDESTQTDVKTDFYTAVNRDWILAQELDDTGAAIEIFNAQKEVDGRRLAILKEEAPQNDPETVGMSAEEYRHAKQILSVFADAAGDVEKRNSLGVEPLRPYIDAIRSIRTMDGMNSFLLDRDGMNIVGAPFIELVTQAVPTSKDRLSLTASPVSMTKYLALKDSSEYTSVSWEGVRNKEVYSEIVTYILGRLGWTEGEIRKILRDSYTWEYILAKNSFYKETYYSLEEYNKDHAVMTPAELQALTGDYPLREIMELLGCGDVPEITVSQPDYMAALGNAYCEGFLENIKAYYITHTVLVCADLLDIPAKELTYAVLNRSVTETEEISDPTGTADAETDENDLTPEERALMAVADDYIARYLPAPMEMMYIVSYCTPEQKAAMTEMAMKIRAAMHDVIRNNEWLTEEGKTGAAEKLDAMELLVLYPDEFDSWLGLNLYEGQNLVEMMHNIGAFSAKRMVQGAGEAYDRHHWDLEELPTTMVNAVNVIDRNAIVILGGIVANGFTFRQDLPDETNLARLGTIIGHEITHGFDSTGYNYDKYGFRMFSDEENSMMTYEDRSAIDRKILNLTVWYTALTPVPGIGGYAAPVSGEAIADFGGMKIALCVAEEEPDFDYDLFFRSYAEQWRKVNTLELEKVYAAADVHPLAFLRVNITLQQYDKFNEVYGIREGDGMYLAPEKRILVW